MDQNDWNKKEQKVRRDERRKISKKRRAKGTLYSLVVLIIALLISIGTGFLGLNPIGIYSDGSGSHSIISYEEDHSPDLVETGDQTGVVRIFAKEDQYIYNDLTYDLDGITEVIEQFEAGSTIDLVDQLAQNLAFEEVEKVLNDAQIEYNIVEDY
jgi:hypothetical protein